MNRIIRPGRLAAPLSVLMAAGLVAAPAVAGHSVGYGANPYTRRVGAPVMPASHNHPNPSFLTAQGGNPALVPNPARTGTRVPLPFPAVSLAATIGAGGTSQITSNGLFRPSRLIVAVNTDTTPLGTTVAITSLFVGSQSCLVSNAAGLTCALFQPNGVEMGITFPTAQPGIPIIISFSNLIATAAVVLPAMLGEYIEGGAAVIAG